MTVRRGLLIILSSPSGAGKSTMSKLVCAWDPSISFSVSATTRIPRQSEVDGQDYHFLTEAEFKQKVSAGKMLEHAQVFGHYYGSPLEPVETSISTGRDVLFDIDWQGAQQIQTSVLGPHTLSIFLLPPSIEELHRRLVSRGQDNDEVIAKRMQKSWDEISHWNEYDYVLINDDLVETAERLKTIVSVTRLKRVQQPDLNAHVMRLQSEFEDRS